MREEKRKTLFKSQNWHKLFEKRVILLRGQTRLNRIIGDGYSDMMMSSAFSWDETHEGYVYWHKISTEWQKLVRDVS